MNVFDGTLSSEQYEYLKSNGVSNKKIEQIESFLYQHKEGLTDYVDLVGDDLIPGKFFFYNLKHYGHLLDLDPDKTFNEKENKLRANITFPIIQRFGKFFLSSPQIIENRNKLIAISNVKKELEKEGRMDKNTKIELLEYEPDKKIVLPKEPVIWTMNHGFKDDVLASVLCISRPFSMFFGSVPQFYNTFDGVLAYNMGSIIVNRKSKESRKFGAEKVKKAMDMGLDILMSPEGVLNKNPHKLLEYFWPGIYRLAKETGCKVVPIVHYIYDPTLRIPKKYNPIHTVVDDPIDITYMKEKEALEYYRDILATWYYLMMENYGITTRKKLLNGYKTSTLAYEDVMQGLISTIDRYDIEFEKTITYHPKDIINPESVFEPIAKINPSKDNILHKNYAQNLVLTRKKEDFQGRF